PPGWGLRRIRKISAKVRKELRRSYFSAEWPQPGGGAPCPLKSARLFSKPARAGKEQLVLSDIESIT
ncbi:MAG: hypothetical protein CO035_06410, partial [Candidatus Omnitrophica bacterium CG_4_9_14_0_2_um_filter_42_8]